MASTQLSKPRKSKVKNAAVWGLSLVLAAVLFRQFGGSSSAPAATKAAALVPPAKLAAGAPLRLTIPDALPRDLFNVAAVFPREAATPTLSGGPKAEDAPDLRATVVAEAQRSIVFQAILLGPEPKAMINGTLCRVGQVIKGFSVRKIEDRRIILEKQGIELVVPLASPANGRD
jgi:hypothetical protein